MRRRRCAGAAVEGEGWWAKAVVAVAEGREQMKAKRREGGGGGQGRETEAEERRVGPSWAALAERSICVVARHPRTPTRMRERGRDWKCLRAAASAAAATATRPAAAAAAGGKQGRA